MRIKTLSEVKQEFDTLSDKETSATLGGRDYLLNMDVVNPEAVLSLAVQNSFSGNYSNTSGPFISDLGKRSDSTAKQFIDDNVVAKQLNPWEINHSSDGSKIFDTPARLKTITDSSVYIMERNVDYDHEIASLNESGTNECVSSPQNSTV